MIIFVPHKRDKKHIIFISVNICMIGWSHGYVYSLLLVKVHVFALTIFIDIIFIDLRRGKS